MMRHFSGLAAAMLVVCSSTALLGQDVHVRGYTRSDGTYVRPHMRSRPDGNFSNNWTTKGNRNPYNGKWGSRTDPSRSYSRPSRRSPVGTSSTSSFAYFRSRLSTTRKNVARPFDRQSRQEPPPALKYTLYFASGTSQPIVDYEDLGDSYRIHGIDGHVDLPKAMIDRFEPSPTPADVVAMFSEVAVADVHEALAQLVAEFISLRVRVLSYNIHHGEGVDGQLDLRRIADVIKSVKPDLVALQEVDAGTQRTNRVDQPAELARLTGMHVVFGGNIAYQGGRYGNAVLSRFPIKRHKNHLLPRLNNGEQRGLLSVEVALPGEGGTLVFLATHLDHRKDDAERLASARLINKLAQAKADQPAVLAGDLNDLPGSRTLREIETLWTRANERVLPTFPVDRPARQIDFILFRPADRWNVIETRVLDEAVASDHRPILAVLALRSGKGE